SVAGLRRSRRGALIFDNRIPPGLLAENVSNFPLPANRLNGGALYGHDLRFSRRETCDIASSGEKRTQIRDQYTITKLPSGLAKAVARPQMGRSVACPLESAVGLPVGSKTRQATEPVLFQPVPSVQ